MGSRHLDEQSTGQANEADTGGRVVTHRQLSAPLVQKKICDSDRHRWSNARQQDGYTEGCIISKSGQANAGQVELKKGGKVTSGFVQSQAEGIRPKMQGGTYHLKGKQMRG